MRLALQFAGAALLLAGSGVSADQTSKPAPPPRPPAGRPAANPNRSPARGAANNGGRGGAPKGGRAVVNNPFNPVQRLAHLTPEERERILEQLPPDRQAQVRKQLEKFDQLPQAQKDRLARQAQSLAALPPEKQRLINQGIVAINHLPEERKPEVAKELRSLLTMAPEDRATVLASDKFKQRYSPQEQKILSDLSNNIPDDYPIFGRR